MKTVGREILWNVPREDAALMYGALGVALAVFAVGAWSRVRAYRRGRPDREDRWTDPWRRAADTLRVALGQRGVVDRSPGGVVHLAVYAAFLTLFAVTCLVAVEHDLGVPFLDGVTYLGFKLFAETAGLLLLAGVGAALVRRCARRRTAGAAGPWEDLLPLILLGAIALTGYLVEAVRIAATSPPAAGFSYVSASLAPRLDAIPPDDLSRLHRGFWWMHLLLALGFLASIPWTKMLHAFAAPANIFFRSTGPKGALAPISDFDDVEAVGAGDVENFSWKQLLDLDACVGCGRCEERCPAHATGKTLSPRKMIRDLRLSMREGKARPPGVAPADLWACTTCGSCEVSCPVMVEHVEKLVDMRRHLVLGNGTMPLELEQMFRRLESFSDPWGMGPPRRTEWAEGLGLAESEGGARADLVLWVGCAGAFDERGRGVARSLADILRASGTGFRILGPEEHCCGDFARRAGNEFLYRMLAARNVEALKKCGAERIVTACPHCYNALKHEYPEFGARFEVLHHTELLLELTHRGRLPLAPAVETVVSYHDPCYLGRYNGLHEAPRRILESMPGVRLVEVARNRERGFCCGGGGGRLWLVEEGERMNEKRAGDFLRLAPEVVATACPHCLYMLEEGISAAGEGGKVPATMDIAEVVAKALCREVLPG